MVESARSFVLILTFLLACRAHTSDTGPDGGVSDAGIPARVGAAQSTARAQQPGGPDPLPSSAMASFGGERDEEFLFASDPLWSVPRCVTPILAEGRTDAPFDGGVPSFTK